MCVLYKEKVKYMDTHWLVTQDIMQRLSSLQMISGQMNYPASQVVADLYNKVMSQGVDSLTAAEAIYVSTLWSEAQSRGILRI